MERALSDEECDLDIDSELKSHRTPTAARRCSFDSAGISDCDANNPLCEASRSTIRHIQSGDTMVSVNARPSAGKGRRQCSSRRLAVRRKPRFQGAHHAMSNSPSKVRAPDALWCDVTPGRSIRGAAHALRATSGLNWLVYRQRKRTAFSPPCRRRAGAPQHTLKTPVKLWRPQPFDDSTYSSLPRRCRYFSTSPIYKPPAPSDYLYRPDAA